MPRRRTSLILLALALAAPASAAGATQHIAGAQNASKPLSAKAVLRKAEAVTNGRARADGGELTPLLKQLAVKLPSLPASERRRARALLYRPTRGDNTSSGESSYTVAEHAPMCSVHFCIHWVTTTADAPPLTDANHDGTPDYVESMDAIFEHVYDVENNQLGWKPPKPDGTRGCPGGAASCQNKTDVYLKNIGDQGIYGYSAPDPGQKTFSQTAYLVMDNDYSERVFTERYPDGPLRPAEVTAAHEYNHVLQFAYDVIQDTWMFEATAVWMEDKVYTEVNDYLQYLTPWAQLTPVPLTQFDTQSPDDPFNVKVYGDAVWNRWLDAKYGETIVRNAWEHSLTSKPKPSFAPGAYQQALAAHRSNFFNAFTSFAADTAEWRDANSPFAEGSTFPDVQRARSSRTGSVIRLAVGGKGASGHLPHTAYNLVDVVHSDARRIKLVLDAPRGPQMAIALVGRVGGQTSGSSTVRLKRLRKGGDGTVTLTDPGRYSRLTAVVINGDARTTGRFSDTISDWQWVSDNVPLALRLSTDFTPPRVTHRSPVPRKHGVSRRAPVKVRFSERVLGLSKKTVWLLSRSGHRVGARVKHAHNGRSAELRPAHRLRGHARYRVRLSSRLEDLGGNRLPRSQRSWTFRTAR